MPRLTFKVPRDRRYGHPDETTCKVDLLVGPEWRPVEDLREAVLVFIRGGHFIGPDLEAGYQAYIAYIHVYIFHVLQLLMRQAIDDEDQ